MYSRIIKRIAKRSKPPKRNKSSQYSVAEPSNKYLKGIEIVVYTHIGRSHVQEHALDKIKPVFIYHRFNISWIRNTVIEFFTHFE